ncbi:MAG: anaerobic sulfatase-maturation protein [Prevotella sp.]|nr:anaerobic sulfatase-maturation protein [Candidatus Equicola faecalis]
MKDRMMYVMLKPVGSRCNLHCRYCYYLNAGVGGEEVMSDDLLERFTREYISAQSASHVMFTWHGGEPTLLPLSFYEKAIALQRKYADGHIIDNSLQTNGTLLTDDWCRFLHDNHWLVGVSIDGTQEQHDSLRCRSWERTMRGIELLNRYEVEWNAMAVVNSKNMSTPKEFYRFFKSIDCRYIQFTPVVEPLDGKLPLSRDAGVTPESVTPKGWGEFCCGVFDEWVREDIGKVFVQLFDATLANWCGALPGVCTLSRECGNAGVMEKNGDVYACDHFVRQEYKLGNITRVPLAELMGSERQQDFARMKAALPARCKSCEFRFACNGECPKNRYSDGNNYLCEGYRMFFRHVSPWMDQLKMEVMNNISAL